MLTNACRRLIRFAIISMIAVSTFAPAFVSVFVSTDAFAASSASLTAAGSCTEIFAAAAAPAHATFHVAGLENASTLSEPQDRATVPRNANIAIAFAQTSKRAIFDETRALIARLKAPAFDLAKFDAALANYTANGLQQPRTREERIAFVQVASRNGGRNPYDLEVWARQAKPADLKRLAKKLGRLNLEKGFSPTMIDSIFETLFKFSNSDPVGFKNRRKLGADKIDRELLMQWATKEIASHNALEGFKSLGLIKDQGTWRRVRDTIKRHPLITTNISIAFLDIFLKSAHMTAFMQAPYYSRLRVTKLDRQLRELIETEGFDAAYPLLKSRYGHLARFDQSFFLARRAATWMWMGFVISTAYPNFVREMVPGALQRPNESIVELTETGIGFYSRQIYALASHGFDPMNDAVIDAKVIPKKPVAPPQAAPPVDDSKISANRVTETFDNELKDSTTVVSNSTDPGDKLFTDTLKYFDKQDAKDPLNH